ncbi:hypothetical protein B0H13DRAFT_2312928 [Mycena leptocephala]|nr:hypothetical protein B0H13DRAFT_2312928 [Mycena leptocephala]
MCHRRSLPPHGATFSLVVPLPLPSLFLRPASPPLRAVPIYRWGAVPSFVSIYLLSFHNLVCAFTAHRTLVPRRAVLPFKSCTLADFVSALHRAFSDPRRATGPISFPTYAAGPTSRSYAYAVALTHVAHPCRLHDGPTPSLTYVAHTYAAAPTSCRPTQPDLRRADHAAGPTPRSRTYVMQTTQPDLRRADLRSRTYVAQTYAAGPTSRRPRSRTYVMQTTQPDLRRADPYAAGPTPLTAGCTSHVSANPISDLAVRTMRPRTGAALRALPRLDVRRNKGRERRFVLSRASTIQWLGDAPRALSRLDDTIAGSCASSSPAPRPALRALPCLDAARAMGQRLGAALRTLPCLDASRTMRQRPGDALRAPPRLDAVLAQRVKGQALRLELSCALMMHDLADEVADAAADLDLFLVQIVNAPTGSEATVLDSLRLKAKPVRTLFPTYL